VRSRSWRVATTDDESGADAREVGVSCRATGCPESVRGVRLGLNSISITTGDFEFYSGILVIDGQYST
jgi:hypothetical protein